MHTTNGAEKSAPFFISMAVFIIYLFHLCPSIYSGDSPLLYTASFGLGSAHQPGYPLFVYIGKLFTLLPFGSIPYKIHLMSAFFGAMTCMVSYYAVRRLTSNTPISVFACLMTAFVPAIWKNSTIAEVYILNTFIISLSNLACILYIKDNDVRWLFASALIIGLGMGNHHTAFFMTIPLGVLVLTAGRSRIIPVALASILFFTIGFGVNAFLYVRALRHLSTGTLIQYTDASTLKGFIDTISRMAYGSSSAGVAAAPLEHPSGLYYGIANTVKLFLFPNLGWVLFAVPFSFLMFRANRKLLLYISAIVLSYFLLLPSMVFSGPAPDNESIIFASDYLLPLIALSVVLISCGLSFIMDSIAKRSALLSRPLSAALIALPVLFLLPANAVKLDLSKYRITDYYTNNFLNSLKPVSIAFAGSDATFFPLAYKNSIERMRDDVMILSSHEKGVSVQISPIWKYETLYPDFVKGKIFTGGMQKYFKSGHIYGADIYNFSESLRKEFDFRYHILGLRLFPKTEKISRESSDREFKDAFGRFDYRSAYLSKLPLDDPFSAELGISFAMTLAHMAYIRHLEGKPDDSFDLLSKSAEFVPLISIDYFIDSILFAGSKDEIEYLSSSYIKMGGLNAKAKPISNAMRARIKQPS